MRTGNFLGDGEHGINNPDVQAALAALERVKAWDRVFAHFSSRRYERIATKRFGAVVTGARWWGWLLHQRMTPHTIDGMPGDDHVEYRQKANGKRYRISQPYHLHWDEMQRLVAFCVANGLKVDIDGDSWWFPSSTITVIIQRAGQSYD